MFAQVLVLLLLIAAPWTLVDARMHASEMKFLQQQAREMFYHGYRNYMEHAFPWDELKPLSCEGRRWDRRERGDLDDVLGGFSLTLIDSLDMLAIMGDRDEFVRAVHLVIDHVSFDRDVTVSVFESTIRVIGGLVSAHMLASSSHLGMMSDDEYHGELLDLAVDLGKRLMPAFETPTGIPVHRVNLQHGVTKDAPTFTCPAAAGSLLVELSYLSRLPGNPTFEANARKAVTALWQRRSSIDLLGSSIDVLSGEWVHSHVGIGAGLDSFFEYLLKYHLISGEAKWLSMFNTSYSAVERHINHDDVHIEVDMNYGRQYVRSQRVSALQAFWPGLQVLAGDVSSAIRSHEKLFVLWNKFGAMPELFDLSGGGSVISWARTAPLRPELIESTYHLYQATRDHKYLKIGRKLLNDIRSASKVKCGYAAIGNIHTLDVEDRMDSYFLSETVKYLYLLFSEDPDLIVPSFTLERRAQSGNSSGDKHSNTTVIITRPLKASDMVFSTEGHVLMLDPELFSRDPAKVTESTFACENGNAVVKQRNEEVEHALKATRTFVQVGVSVRLDDVHVMTLVASPADFGAAVSAVDHLEAPLMLYSRRVGEACTPLTIDVAGKIVMVRRGTCSFAEKAIHLQEAGAVGMVIINHRLNNQARKQAERKYFISDDARGLGKNVYIPLVMVAREDAAQLHRLMGERMQPQTASMEDTSDVTEEASVMATLSPWLM
ncbi:TPA: hypothetical protein N0F65_000162 [Lagenidium giganteum]|uniref:alpha-1,2-Mannosidase n=1 Tax=Lagenidium giganteum TaxID=4803 RepID=A0AAV2YS85_9STRA|nr:TPA: hypothetical protein N0F65_000162 [Lagenidium giganteum]